MIRVEQDVSTLREFIVRKMVDLGIRSQVDLATASGLTKSEINALLKSRVKLPGASKRRGLAKALGVSHLDLLVAAGEITKDEAGNPGPPLFEPGTAKAEIAALLPGISDDYAGLIRDLMRDRLKQGGPS